MSEDGSAPYGFCKDLRLVKSLRVVVVGRSGDGEDAGEKREEPWQGVIRVLPWDRNPQHRVA